MPLVDPELIDRARAVAEKRAFSGTLLGGLVGAAEAPEGHAWKGLARGAGVGLTTDLGIPIGGVLGGGLGGLGGAALGAGLGSLTGHREGAQLGAIGGGLLGLGAGASLGGVAGGVGGYRFGKHHIWNRPWDRELPHGVSGGDADDEDKGGLKKAASFAARMGELAAARTRK